MQKHFISLFDSAHIRWTISLIAVAVLFIITASLVGVADSVPGIALLYGGIISLFFSVLHPWKNAGNYGILILVCIGILLLEWLGITILDKMNKDEYIKDGIAEGIVFFICIPGILAGIIGAIICAVRKK